MTSKGQQAINELFNMLEENKETLSDRIEFSDDNGSGKIHVIDSEAESSDETFVFESYSAYEVHEWLLNNKYLAK